MPVRGQCELCSLQAAVYCHADIASLCWSCDEQVHSLNFLVKRHVRTLLCSKCHAPTSQLVTTWMQTTSIPSFCYQCSLQKQIYCGHDQLSLPLLAPRFSQDSEYSNRFQVKTLKQSTANIEVPFSALTKQSEPLKGDVSLMASEIFCSESSAYKQSRKGSTQHISKETIDFQCHEESEFCSDSNSSIQSSDRKRKTSETRDINQDKIYSCCKKMHVLDGIARKQTQLEPAIEAKLEVLLSKWHSDLGMIEHGTVQLAMHLFQRAIHVVRSSSMQNKITRVLLAVCLSLAAKLCEQKTYIPTSRHVEKCTGVSQKLLQMCEVQLCNLLKWSKLLEEWAESTP